MTISVTHTTPADDSFSAEGAAAWDAGHAVAGLGTMAEQNANNVAITGGTISGVTVSGVVTSVSGTAPIASSGGTTPAISISQAGTASNGYLSSTDWNTFNAKAASGANSDITSLTGLTGAVSSAAYVDFNTSSVVPAAVAGRMYWDNTNGNSTVSLVMAGGDVIQQIGEEQYYRVRASSAITNGQVVMFTGTVGATGVLKAAPATGLTASTAMYMMGIATQDIGLNSYGYVTSFGLVRDIDTRGGAEAWVDGQILYLDPSVAGGLTKNVPTAPNPKVQVCAVVNAGNQNNGSVFVRPAFGGTLGQFEGDVQVTTPTAGNLLTYDGDHWYNATSVSGGTF